MIRALRCIAYLAIMCVVAFSLGSCASPYVPLRGINIQARGADSFTADQIELTRMAANAWNEAIPEARLPVMVATKARGGSIQPIRGKACEGPVIGFTSLRPTVAPQIFVCVDDVAEEDDDLLAFYLIVLHEIGHALSMRGDHLPEGNVMHSSIEPSSETPGVITDADIAYVREGMGL